MPPSPRTPLVISTIGPGPWRDMRSSLLIPLQVERSLPPRVVRGLPDPQKEDPGHSHANRESKENDATPWSQWCYKCRKHGHLTRDCSQKGKSEASGRTARAAALVASPTEVSSPLSGFSVQQLEEHLAARKLSSESSLMEAVNQTGAEVDVVSSDPKVSRVVGPTPYFGIVVEGVQVSALVDSGSQSTIISRPLLHQVARKKASCCPS